MFELTFDVDLLDSKSIQRSVDYLNSYNQRIDRVIALALPEIADRIEARLLLEMSQMGLGDSSLASSILVNVVGDGINVTIASDHAMYIEFGTGIRGETNSHPKPDWITGWQYDVNEHGEEGWWYPTDQSDPNPTKRTNSNGVTYAWTKGHESRPFMYNTWRYARRMAPQIFNKHMKKVFT